MKYLIFMLISISSIDHVFSQVSSFIELQKINSFGPQGTTFYSFSEKDKSEFTNLYPITTNVPETWSDVREYYYVLNEKQLLFQSYLEGHLDKKTLSAIFSKKNYLLQDTVNLSRESLECGISFAVGKEKDSDNYSYILDRNHNNDFGDDIVKKLNSQNNLSRDDISGDSINYQYYYQSNIIHDTLLLSLSLSDDKYVYVSIPQYYLGIISLNEKSYFICKNLGGTGVYVLPVLPYFSPIKADRRLLLGNYFTIDGFQFTLKNVNYDGKYIEIEGPVKLNNGTITVPQFTKTEKISAQTGYKAPPISGINVLDGKKWSLDSLNNDKYIFMYFWSTTCGPCIEDLKNLTSIANEYKDKVEFIGICDVRSDLNKILTSNLVKWPNLVLQKSSINQKDYNIFKYPTSFLLNKNHIVEKIDLRSGELRKFLELN